MRIKNYISLLAAMLTIALAGCTDSYPGTEYQPVDPNLHANDIPIKVILNKPSLYTYGTRGTGSFDGKNPMKYKNAIFYVYAFRAKDDVQGDLATPVTLTSRMSGDSASLNCLVDGTIYNIGMAAKIAANGSSTLAFVDEQTKTQKKNMYYSNMYDDIGYNFFAYHIDDYQPTAANFHRDTDMIYYDLVVDGAQDILVGKAPSLTLTTIDSLYDRLKLSDEKRIRFANIGAYNTYAGKAGVHPIIDMNHALTKIKFEFVAGDELVEDIKLRDVTLTGKNAGKLVVAAKDLDLVGFHPNERYATLHLRESSSDGVTPGFYIRENNGYQLHWNDSLAAMELFERPAHRLGESIMLVPAQSYIMGVDYQYTFEAIDTVQRSMAFQTIDAHIEYELTAPHDSINYDKATESYIFKPENEYTVTFAIRGRDHMEARITSRKNI